MLEAGHIWGVEGGIRFAKNAHFLKKSNVLGGILAKNEAPPHPFFAARTRN